MRPRRSTVVIGVARTLARASEFEEMFGLVVTHLRFVYNQLVTYPIYSRS